MCQCRLTFGNFLSVCLLHLTQDGRGSPEATFHAYISQDGGGSPKAEVASSPGRQGRSAAQEGRLDMFTKGMWPHAFSQKERKASRTGKQGMITKAPQQQKKLHRKHGQRCGEYEQKTHAFPQKARGGPKAVKQTARSPGVQSRGMATRIARIKGRP